MLDNNIGIGVKTYGLKVYNPHLPIKQTPPHLSHPNQENKMDFEVFCFKKSTSFK